SVKSKCVCLEGSEGSVLSGKSASDVNMLGHVTGLARLQQIPTVRTFRGKRRWRAKKRPAVSLQLNRWANNAMIPEACALRPSSLAVQGSEQMRGRGGERGGHSVEETGGRGRRKASERRAVPSSLLPACTMAFSEQDRVTFSPVETAGMVQSCISAAQCAAHPLLIGGGGTRMQSRGGCKQEQGGVRAGRVLRIKGELHLLQTASCTNYSGPYMLC
ncbi:hypothetical protein CRENBAI_001892, partial [Crenichthys baileyi]